jgi:hypothetical protein
MDLEKGYFTSKRLVGLLFLISGGILLRETFTFQGGFMMDEGAMGPMSYPRYLLYGWLAASLLYFLFPGKDKAENISQSRKALLVAAVAITAYVFLFQYVGFLEATIIFLLAFFYAEGYRNYKLAVPIALGSSLLFWFVFEKLLAVPMPGGFLSALMQ